jgi:hypothetical protein
VIVLILIDGLERPFSCAERSLFKKPMHRQILCLQDMCSYERHLPMSAFGPRPSEFDLYYAAIDKQTGQTVAIGMSAPGVLADASEKTGLPKDCFELLPISKEEYERLYKA